MQATTVTTATEQTAPAPTDRQGTPSPDQSRTREEALERVWINQRLASPQQLGEAKERYEACLEKSIQPRTIHQMFLIGQAAWAMARMEHMPLIEEEARKSESLRAQMTWEQDRAAEAAKLGARLLKRPAIVTAELQRTAHGACWLIEQWFVLLSALDNAGKWNEEQRQRAGALLGIPLEDQPTHFRMRDFKTPEGCRQVAASELERLTVHHRDVLQDLDERERLLAVQGVSFDVSPPAWRMRRHEQNCFKKLLWAETLLERMDAGEAGLLWRGFAASAGSGDSIDSIARHGQAESADTAASTPDPTPAPSPSEPASTATPPASEPAPPPEEPSISKRSQSTETQFDKDLQEAIRIAADPVAWTIAGLNDPASATTLKHGASLVPPGLAPRKANRRNGRRAR